MQPSQHSCVDEDYVDQSYKNKHLKTHAPCIVFKLLNAVSHLNGCSQADKVFERINEGFDDREVYETSEGEFLRKADFGLWNGRGQQQLR